MSWVAVAAIGVFMKTRPYELNGRIVIDVDIEHDFNDDYSTIISASYEDDGSELTDDELDQLAASYSDRLDDDRYEALVSKAEDYADSFKDGTRD